MDDNMTMIYGDDDFDECDHDDAILKDTFIIKIERCPFIPLHQIHRSPSNFVYYHHHKFYLIVKTKYER